MSKKIVIIIATMLIVLGFITYIIYINYGNQSSNELGINETQKENLDEVNKEKDTENILVVYYSAQNHTKTVAEKIAKNLNADLFEIVPEEIYTAEDLEWSNDNSRISKEYADENLRNIKLTKTYVENFENYETVLIGYPIWWEIAAWPVNTFVKANDFSGKTVIPFCTSSISGLGQSGKLLEKEAKSGNWLEGHRFSSKPSNLEIKNWTDSLKQI